MDPTFEVIDKPLTPEELGEKYRRMCDDPYFANVPGKLEIDTWGRIIMSPASNDHGRLQAELSRRLFGLAGQAFVEASVATPAGLFVPDVAWASAESMAKHGNETPFTRAPDLCIEVAPRPIRSRSSTRSLLPILRRARSKHGSSFCNPGASTSAARKARSSAARAQRVRDRSLRSFRLSDATSSIHRSWP